GRAGFRDALARGVGSGRTKCAHFAFDELLDAGRTRARSNGPFLFESDPARRRFSSRTATAGFSAGRWRGDGVADAQINALRLFRSRRLWAALRSVIDVDPALRAAKRLHK